LGFSSCHADSLVLFTFINKPAAQLISARFSFGKQGKDILSEALVITSCGDLRAASGRFSLRFNPAQAAEGKCSLTQTASSLKLAVRYGEGIYKIAFELCFKRGGDYK
jgi:hypothetical protein